jgi:hypothetical protein
MMLNPPDMAFFPVSHMMRLVHSIGIKAMPVNRATCPAY